MKAIKIVNSSPLFSDCAGSQGSGVLVRVVSSSICGTDLRLLPSGILEGRTPGHECAGHTPDGKAVAIEPFHSKAAKILFEHPRIADSMITLRFPLDGAAEAFATAADKNSGAIKVAFDVS